MQKSVHFRVDPKLAHVLGENYTSSEKALKELIDNAWAWKLEWLLTELSAQYSQGAASVSQLRM